MVLVDFIFSMKWAIIIFMLLIYDLSDKVISLYKNKKNRDLEYKYSMLKYNEEEIINHLDLLISNVIDEYVLLNLKPKQVVYISNKMETKMRDEIKDIVTDRVPDVLLTQLGLLCKEEKLGEFIGIRIYIQVLSYIINYNIENSNN